MECKCTGPGFCATLNREQTAEHFEICQRTTCPKAEVIKQNWLRLAGVPIDPDYCPHRGPATGRVETCHTCGNRGKQVAIHQCAVFGECSLTSHHVGQAEHVCHGCAMKPQHVMAKWDRKIERLIPSPDNQNFNCSLIDFHGRKLLAYRHRWSAARIGLCELNSDWQVMWNTLLEFTRTQQCVYQEDPRLFIFRDELHIAFTSVEAIIDTNRPTVHVGYARLKEAAPSTWQVQECHVPQYSGRQLWEKNWGFFEADGQLWAVYDASRHTILSIVGSRAKLAYQHPGATIPGNFGAIRGGASPQFFRGQFYSFVHFRRPPKNYAGGLYTFDAEPPFAPISYLPYQLLNPSPAHCSNQHASQVVYPCGAALLDWRWVISYGGYDKDSRLAAYDFNEVKNAMKNR